MSLYYKGLFILVAFYVIILLVMSVCHGSTPRPSVRPCPLAGGQGQWPVT
jgi:hypothetical protein